MIPVTMNIAVGGVIVIIYLWNKARLSREKYGHIPTIGSDGFIASYISAFKYMLNGHHMIQEGYDKYPGQAFKVSTLFRWIIVVTGSQMTDDVRRAPNDHLSLTEVFAETLQSDYLIGPEICADEYHVGIVRTPLTKSIVTRFHDIQDEISNAFVAQIPPTEEWTSYQISRSLVGIVCRTANRVFVGFPLCRNLEFTTAIEQFAVHLFIGANIINMFPPFLRGLMGHLLTKVPQTIRTVEKHLMPILEERREHDETYGRTRADRPNDLISWLLDAQQEKQRTLRDLMLRVVAINFAAIHTTSTSMTNVLFNLAAYPEYVAPLREEVESIISTAGWSKDSINKMHKVDSFIKESQRLDGIGALILGRKVMKDFTFSNGITLPAGALVTVPNFAIHHDEANYDDPYTFKGFRFADQRDGEDQLKDHKSQMVSLGLDYIVFGHGRHACPGRFFAVTLLKTMLAHVLLNYDVKLPNDGPRPDALWFAAQSTPNRQAEVLFRKRLVRKDTACY